MQLLNPLRHMAGFSHSRRRSASLNKSTLYTKRGAKPLTQEKDCDADAHKARATKDGRYNFTDRGEHLSRPSGRWRFVRRFVRIIDSDVRHGNAPKICATWS